MRQSGKAFLMTTCFAFVFEVSLKTSTEHTKVKHVVAKEAFLVSPLLFGYCSTVY